MNSSETLPTKQKHLIGVGASIAAGCQPCTASFAAAAQAAGACDRGLLASLESGLSGREEATLALRAFAARTFAQPELDAAFRAERARLDALIGVAAAVAGNASTLIPTRVDAARALGATDDQVRLAVQIARTAKRGAEKQTEAAVSAALGEDPAEAGCCTSQSDSNCAGGCGCRGSPAISRASFARARRL